MVGQDMRVLEEFESINCEYRAEKALVGEKIILCGRALRWTKVNVNKCAVMTFGKGVVEGN